jgi:cell division septal protein FtsQ
MNKREKLSKITQELERNERNNTVKKQRKERIFSFAIFFLIITGLGVLITFYLGI